MTELQTMTAYFAERERSGGRFLAEDMLNLFDQQGVAAGIMLRGIASFGPTNVLRGDRSLSLSEDPPVSVTAVDTADRIAELTERVVAMTDRGVITLEPATTPDNATTPHNWVQLTAYLAGRHRPDYLAACAVLHRLGFACAEVFLGVDGTVAGRRRRARFFSRNDTVPVVISGVGSPLHAAAAIDELRGMLPDALITVARTQVCKRDGETVAGPGRSAGYRKLTVRTAEDSLHDGRPIHRALIRRLKESEHASGATVLRGIWGFRGAQRPHGDRLLQLTRHVPVSTVMIDTAEHIALTYPIVDELTREAGLVTIEEVPTVWELHPEARAEGKPGRR
jgi:PII-like signaling protein